MPKLFMNEKQIKSLLSLSSPWPRDHALFQVALATGFRASDLIALKRDDVEDGRGFIVKTVRIKMRKTGRIIERELPEPVRFALQLYLSGREDFNPYLFPAQSNNTQGDMAPMNRSSMHRIFKRYLGAVFGLIPELKGNACHVTRRSVAKIISDRAGRIEPATRFLGHTSVANTVAYLDMDAYGKQADEIVQNLPWNKTP
jgi:integrase